MSAALSFAAFVLALPLLYRLVVWLQEPQR